MKRLKPIIPDAINRDCENNFTMVPNELLRNPNLSCKAKATLCLLLTNKSGWKSYMDQLQKYTKEGPETLSNAMRELEKAGYVVRLKYRHKESKQWMGHFWAYASSPSNFKLDESFEMLDKYNFEVPESEKERMHRMQPLRKNPVVAKNNGFERNADEHGESKPPGHNGVFRETANPVLKRLKNNKTNERLTQDAVSQSLIVNGRKSAANGYITPDDFHKFFNNYPKSRRGSEGHTLFQWEKLCQDKKNRPTLKTILDALEAQKKTPQWQTERFIIFASKWIKEKRWLDDPASMVSWDTQSEERRESKEVDNDAEWARNFGYDKDEDED